MISKIHGRDSPKVYEKDRYAAVFCEALHLATTKVWSDAEKFKAQLFAHTATEAGYELWLSYLSLTNKTTSRNKLPTILEHLQSDCSFTRSSVDARIKKILGNVFYAVTEGVNSVSILIPDSISEAKVSALRIELEKIRPLHLNLKVRLVPISNEMVSFYISPETGELVMEIPENYYGEFDPSTMENVSITFNATNGNLQLNAPADYSGAEFAIEKGKMEVVVASKTMNLGRVAIIPRGEYDGNTNYEPLDVVRHEGKTYIVCSTVKGEAPSENSTKYMLLAEDGKMEATPLSLAEINAMFE